MGMLGKNKNNRSESVSEQSILHPKHRKFLTGELKKVYQETALDKREEWNEEQLNNLDWPSE